MDTNVCHPERSARIGALRLRTQSGASIRKTDAREVQKTGEGAGKALVLFPNSQLSKAQRYSSKLASSSSGVTVAVPSFPTTIPLA